MAVVEEHCDRAILIDHGSIIVDGRADEAIATYRTLLTPEVVAAH
jgi:ABC-type polysaccharide/polyol phosphate transport system ATPase subunit